MKQTKETSTVRTFLFLSKQKQETINKSHGEKNKATIEWHGTLVYFLLQCTCSLIIVLES